MSKTVKLVVTGLVVLALGWVAWDRFTDPLLPVWGSAGVGAVGLGVLLYVWWGALRTKKAKPVVQQEVAATPQPGAGTTGGAGPTGGSTSAGVAGGDGSVDAATLAQLAGAQPSAIPKLASPGAGQVNFLVHADAGTEMNWVSAIASSDGDLRDILVRLIPQGRVLGELVAAPDGAYRHSVPAPASLKPSSQMFQALLTRTDGQPVQAALFHKEPGPVDSLAPLLGKGPHDPAKKKKVGQGESAREMFRVKVALRPLTGDEDGILTFSLRIGANGVAIECPQPSLVGRIGKLLDRATGQVQGVSGVLKVSAFTDPDGAHQYKLVGPPDLVAAFAETLAVEFPVQIVGREEATYSTAGFPHDGTIEVNSAGGVRVTIPASLLAGSPLAGLFDAGAVTITASGSKLTECGSGTAAISVHRAKDSRVQSGNQMLAELLAGILPGEPGPVTGSAGDDPQYAATSPGFPQEIVVQATASREEAVVEPPPAHEAVQVVDAQTETEGNGNGDPAEGSTITRVAVVDQAESREGAQGTPEHRDVAAPVA